MAIVVAMTTELVGYIRLKGGVLKYTDSSCKSRYHTEVLNTCSEGAVLPAGDVSRATPIDLQK